MCFANRNFILTTGQCHASEVIVIPHGNSVDTMTVPVPLQKAVNPEGDTPRQNLPTRASVAEIETVFEEVSDLQSLDDD